MLTLNHRTAGANSRIPNVGIIAFSAANGATSASTDSIAGCAWPLFTDGSPDEMEEYALTMNCKLRDENAKIPSTANSIPNTAALANNNGAIANMQAPTHGTFTVNWSFKLNSDSSVDDVRPTMAEWN